MPPLHVLRVRSSVFFTVRRAWPWRKCIETLVGTTATVLVFYWKGPAATVMYLLLVFWSFVIYDTVLLAQTQASISRRTSSSLRFPPDGGTGPRGPIQVRNSRQLQPSPRGDQTPGTPSIFTSSWSQDSPFSSQEVGRSSRFTSSTSASAHDTVAVGPSATGSTHAATSATGSATDDRQATNEYLTPRTRRRRWTARRPLTPIVIMKPCPSASERHVSPRRPLAPVNIEQRQNSRPTTTPMGESSPVLLPKPWPSSMSRVDQESPYHRRFTAAPCHPQANCSGSGCSFPPYLPV